MTEHVVYGLYSPDNPRYVLYVGSWKAATAHERIAQHRRGESKQTKKMAARDGIALETLGARVLCHWQTGESREHRVMRLCMAFGMAPWNKLGNVLTSEDNRKGGRNGGPKGGRRRIELHGNPGTPEGNRKAVAIHKANGWEHQKKIAGKGVRAANAIHEANGWAHLSKAGRKGAFKRNELYGNPATPESRRKGLCKAAAANEANGWEAQRAGVRKGNHLRWHVNRGIVDPDCELCPAVTHQLQFEGLEA